MQMQRRVRVRVRVLRACRAVQCSALRHSTYLLLRDLELFVCALQGGRALALLLSRRVEFEPKKARVK